MLADSNEGVAIRWTADTRGRITYFNQDWARYTGVADQEVCGSADAWIACVHPDDHNVVRSIWSARASQLDSYVIRFRLLGADGIFRKFQGVALPVKRGQEVSAWQGYCELLGAEHAS